MPNLFIACSAIAGKQTGTTFMEKGVSMATGSSRRLPGAYGPPSPVTNPRASLRVKVATGPFELEQIYALNHKTFVEEIPRYAAAPNGRLVDRFDAENTYVIGLRHERVVGMVAIRGTRPFSLDERLPGLDSYLPPGRSTCELRLLAIDRRDRRGRLLPLLLEAVWRHTRVCGYDLAIISGIVQQQKLYAHLGFEPFGPLIGTPEARFQPMMLTLERFAPRARALFRNIET